MVLLPLRLSQYISFLFQGEGKGLRRALLLGMGRLGSDCCPMKCVVWGGVGLLGEGLAGQP